MNQFTHELPFTISLEDSSESHVQCERVLRHVPGKRLVCKGSWRHNPVIVKLFLDPKSAVRHWARERDGVKSLSEAKVPTPELVFSGLLDNGTPVLLFEFLGNVKTASEVWADLPSLAAKATSIRNLIGMVACLHSAGLVQSDLHLGNFLVSRHQVFAIDGDAVRKRANGKPLSIGPSVRNLALFFAQLLPEDDHLIEQAVQRYAQLRNFSSMAILERLERELPKVRRKRRQKYVHKSYRSCSEFVRSRRGGQVVVSRRDLLGDNLDRLFRDPDRFMRGGELLKDGNTCTVVRVQNDDFDWVIKRYNIKGPLHALSRCLRPTRAWISWGNAHRLKISGIATPRAVAVIEKRFGPLRSTGYYVCDYQDGPLASSYFEAGQADSSDFKQVCENFVHLFGLFKKLGINHGDCKATNFLLVDNAPCVLDLDAMREPITGARFRKLFRVDRERFLRNWQSLSHVEAWFDEHLPR